MPREWIDWHKNFEKVVVGHSLTTGPDKYNMARTLLRGDALRVFNRAALEAGMETNEHLQQVMNVVTKHVFPLCALAKQKHWMCWQLRKPEDTTVRQYVTAIQEMNQDFKYFPDAGDNPFLPEDELADIVEAGCPNTWQHQELIQGFDATGDVFHSVVVIFCAQFGKFFFEFCIGDSSCQLVKVCMCSA